jgi:methylated-DNA-protein-cysteine methyltransferase-like protein
MRSTSKSSAQQPKRAKSRSPPRLAFIADNPAWEAIYATVDRIPRGSVATYGGIAQLAGFPRRARLVGTALKRLPRARKLPWHRVLTASGRLAFPIGSDAYRKQQMRLQREGVPLIRGRVDLQRYGWPRDMRNLDETLWRIDG